MPFLFNDPTNTDRRRRLRSSQTDAEQRLWKHLRGKQIHDLRFLRQYGVGPYILDFYCPAIRLAIELDGGQHLEHDQEDYDNRRTAFLKTEDIRVLRFFDNDVLNTTASVLDAIEQATPPL